MLMPDGLQTTKMVDRGRIELPSLRCKRSIIPSILTAQIRRGLSFAMTVCTSSPDRLYARNHATRLLSVMPPRNTTYSVRPPYCCHSDTHTDKLSHCRDVFSFLFNCVLQHQGHTQSMAGEVGIEPTMTFVHGLTVRCITSLRTRQLSIRFQSSRLSTFTIIFSTKCWLLAVAVWTYQLEIFWSIIRCITINMINPKS